MLRQGARAAASPSTSSSAAARLDNCLRAVESDREPLSVHVDAWVLIGQVVQKYFVPSTTTRRRSPTTATTTSTASTTSSGNTRISLPPSKARQSFPVRLVKRLITWAITHSRLLESQQQQQQQQHQQQHRDNQTRSKSRTATLETRREAAAWALGTLLSCPEVVNACDALLIASTCDHVVTLLCSSIPVSPTVVCEHMRKMLSTSLFIFGSQHFATDVLATHLTTRLLPALTRVLRYTPFHCDTVTAKALSVLGTLLKRTCGPLMLRDDALAVWLPGAWAHVVSMNASVRSKAKALCMTVQRQRRWIFSDTVSQQAVRDMSDVSPLRQRIARMAKVAANFGQHVSSKRSSDQDHDDTRTDVSDETTVTYENAMSKGRIAVTAWGVLVGFMANALNNRSVLNDILRTPAHLFKIENDNVRAVCLQSWFTFFSAYIRCDVQQWRADQVGLLNRPFLWGFQHWESPVQRAHLFDTWARFVHRCGRRTHWQSPEWRCALQRFVVPTLVGPAFDVSSASLRLAVLEFFVEALLGRQPAVETEPHDDEATPPTLKTKGGDTKSRDSGARGADPAPAAPSNATKGTAKASHRAVCVDAQHISDAMEDIACMIYKGTLWLIGVRKLGAGITSPKCENVPYLKKLMQVAWAYWLSHIRGVEPHLVGMTGTTTSGIIAAMATAAPRTVDPQHLAYMLATLHKLASHACHGHFGVPLGQWIPFLAQCMARVLRDIPSSALLCTDYDEFLRSARQVRITASAQLIVDSNGVATQQQQQQQKQQHGMPSKRLRSDKQQESSTQGMPPSGLNGDLTTRALLQRQVSDNRHTVSTAAEPTASKPMKESDPTKVAFEANDSTPSRQQSGITQRNLRAQRKRMRTQAQSFMQRGASKGGSGMMSPSSPTSPRTSATPVSAGMHETSVGQAPMVPLLLLAESWLLCLPHEPDASNKEWTCWLTVWNRMLTAFNPSWMDTMRDGFVWMDTLTRMLEFVGIGDIARVADSIQKHLDAHEEPPKDEPGQVNDPSHSKDSSLTPFSSLVKKKKSTVAIALSISGPLISQWHNRMHAWMHCWACVARHLETNVRNNVPVASRRLDARQFNGDGRNALLTTITHTLTSPLLLLCKATSRFTVVKHAAVDDASACGEPVSRMHVIRVTTMMKECVHNAFSSLYAAACLRIPHNNQVLDEMCARIALHLTKLTSLVTISTSSTNTTTDAEPAHVFECDYTTAMFVELMGMTVIPSFVSQFDRVLMVPSSPLVGVPRTRHMHSVAHPLADQTISSLMLIIRDSLRLAYHCRRLGFPLGAPNKLFTHIAKLCPSISDRDTMMSVVAILSPALCLWFHHFSHTTDGKASPVGKRSVATEVMRLRQHVILVWETLAKVIVRCLGSCDNAFVEVLAPLLLATWNNSISKVSQQSRKLWNDHMAHNVKQYPSCLAPILRPKAQSTDADLPPSSGTPSQGDEDDFMARHRLRQRIVSKAAEKRRAHRARLSGGLDALLAKHQPHSQDGDGINEALNGSGLGIEVAGARAMDVDADGVSEVAATVATCSSLDTSAITSSNGALRSSQRRSSLDLSLGDEPLAAATAVLAAVNMAVREAPALRKSVSKGSKPNTRTQTSPTIVLEEAELEAMMHEHARQERERQQVLQRQPGGQLKVAEAIRGEAGAGGTDVAPHTTLSKRSKRHMRVVVSDEEDDGEDLEEEDEADVRPLPSSGSALALIAKRKRRQFEGEVNANASDADGARGDAVHPEESGKMGVGVRREEEAPASLIQGSFDDVVVEDLADILGTSPKASMDGEGHADGVMLSVMQDDDDHDGAVLVQNSQGAKGTHAGDPPGIHVSNKLFAPDSDEDEEDLEVKGKGAKGRRRGQRYDEASPPSGDDDNDDDSATQDASVNVPRSGVNAGDDWAPSLHTSPVVVDDLHSDLHDRDEAVNMMATAPTRPAPRWKAEDDTSDYMISSMVRRSDTDHDTAGEPSPPRRGRRLRTAESPLCNKRDRDTHRMPSRIAGSDAAPMDAPGAMKRARVRSRDASVLDTASSLHVIQWLTSSPNDPEDAVADAHLLQWLQSMSPKALIDLSNRLSTLSHLAVSALGSRVHGKDGAAE